MILALLAGLAVFAAVMSVGREKPGFSKRVPGGIRAYQAHIGSAKWNERKREKGLGRARCRCCFVLRSRELHHESYDNFGDEKDSDLIPLCKVCHSLAHYLHHSRILGVGVVLKACHHYVRALWLLLYFAVAHFAWATLVSGRTSLFEAGWSFWQAMRGRVLP